MFGQFKAVHCVEFDQVLQLLAVAKKANERDWLMICVAFIHALRASEVCGGWTVKHKKGKLVHDKWFPGLMPANIVGARLRLTRLKGSNPVDDELNEDENPLLNERKALFDLCRITPRNQKLFPVSARTFQRRMNAYGQAAGLPKLYCHPHTLKHSIITHLRKTMDLDELQDRSGHKSLDSLRVYLNPKKSETDAMVREALRVS